MSDIQDIPLNMIRPNPFQTRMREDPEAVAEMVESLRKLRKRGVGTKGLLQVPLARIDPRNAARVQLAFGHTRWMAFEQLARSDGRLWDEMPLVVAELTDEEMSELAIRENRERKDLSAVEEARAMKRHMEEFGRTQEEIAALFGYENRSTVANKVRLLNLPAGIQEKVIEGEMSERQARALLPLTRFGDEVVEKLVTDVENPYLGPQRSIGEISSDMLEQKANHEVWHRTAEMPGWPPEWPGERHGLDVKPCRGCEYFVELKKERRCAEPTTECVVAKEKAWWDHHLKRIAAETWCPVLEEGAGAYYPSRWSFQEKERLDELIKDHDDHLRIAIADMYHGIRVDESLDKIVWAVTDEDYFLGPMKAETNAARAAAAAETREKNKATMKVLDEAVPKMAKVLEGLPEAVIEYLVRELKGQVSWSPGKKQLMRAMEKKEWTAELLIKVLLYRDYRWDYISSVKGRVEKINKLARQLGVPGWQDVELVEGDKR